jgi:hypothetical protein
MAPEIFKMDGPDDRYCELKTRLKCLAGESDGVTGYHPNGELMNWEEVWEYLNLSEDL